MWKSQYLNTTPPYALPTSFEALTNLKKHGKMPLFLRVENTKKGIAKINENVPKSD